MEEAGKIGSSYIFSQQKIKAETSLTMIKKKTLILHTKLQNSGLSCFVK